MTGESTPADKSPGDRVFGSTVNVQGLLKVRATGVGKDTALARSSVWSALHREQTSHPAYRRPSVGGLRPGDHPHRASLLHALVDARGIVRPRHDTDGRGARDRMPCALGLATPTAVMVGSGKGPRWASSSGTARRSKPRTASRWSFSTRRHAHEGKPVLTDWIGLGSDPVADLALAAGAESGSEHPLSRAVLEGARERGITR